MNPTRPGDIAFAIVPDNIERETRVPVKGGAIERREVKKPGIPKDTKIPKKDFLVYHRKCSMKYIIISLKIMNPNQKTLQRNTNLLKNKEPLKLVFHPLVLIFIEIFI